PETALTPFVKVPTTVRPVEVAKHSDPFARRQDQSSAERTQPTLGRWLMWASLASAAALGLAFMIVLATVQLIRPKDAVIEITGLPDDAEVYVDGSKAAITRGDGTKSEIRVKPRMPHEVEVRANGLKIQEDTVTVASGGRQELKVPTKSDVNSPAPGPHDSSVAPGGGQGTTVPAKSKIDLRPTVSPDSSVASSERQESPPKSNGKPPPPIIQDSSIVIKRGHSSERAKIPLLDKEASLEKRFEGELQLILEYISDKYQVTFFIDSSSIARDLGFSQIEKTKIALPKMPNTTLAELLDLLLSYLGIDYFVSKEKIHVTSKLQLPITLEKRTRCSARAAFDAIEDCAKVKIVTPGLEQSMLKEVLVETATDLPISIVLERILRQIRPDLSFGLTIEFGHSIVKVSGK
ncbi:MAG: hypothetical protein ACJ8F7_15370, partial [Gemmataceae bacterium]